MDRIDDVHSTKLPAHVPENFNLADWLEHSFGVFRSNTGQLQTIRIHFASEVARYVKESNWHTSLKLTPQDDGSLIVEIQLTDTQEIKSWIMSFGPNAKVLGSEALVEETQKDLEVMLDDYQQWVAK